MLVRADPKLLDDGEDIPNVKEKVGSSIAGYEISSLPDIKFVRWSTASCALALAFVLNIYNELAYIDSSLESKNLLHLHVMIVIYCLCLFIRNNKGCII